MPEPDVHLYTLAPDRYDAVQEARPDYRGAIVTALRLTRTILAAHPRVTLVDFGGGTGANIERLLEGLPIHAATIVDTNARFLQIARRRLAGHRVTLRTIHGDAASIDPGDTHEAALSLFVYHHIPDPEKLQFLRRVSASLVAGGTVIVAEIYVPDRGTTLRYYDALIDAIPDADRTEELCTFLRETARSERFEYKVPKSRADADFAGAGLTLAHETRIWPRDDSFPSDVGTFVQVYVLR